MIRIAALNQSDDDHTSSADAKLLPAATVTKEYQETNAFALYNQALSLQKAGENTKAEHVLRKLLACEYFSEVINLSLNESTDVSRSMLKYSAYKNLASIAAQRKDCGTAIEAILEAVKIDSTDVTMWYKLGVLAKESSQISLARKAFEEGLRCNPNHWPCLDNLITILYVVTDYLSCLCYVSKALEKDSLYAKGIVLRRRMYKEQPSLRDYTEPYFELCDPEIDDVTVDEIEENELLNEVTRLRQKRMEDGGPEFRKLSEITFPGGLSQVTWLGLGVALMQLYDLVISKKPDLSLGCRVDVSQYLKATSTSEDVEDIAAHPSHSESVDTPDNSGAALSDAVPLCVAGDIGACTVTGERCAAENASATSMAVDAEVTAQLDSHANDAPALLLSPDGKVQLPAGAVPSGGCSEGTGKRTYKRKRPINASSLDDLNLKRRSARVHVRNAHGKKDEGKVNYNAVLRRLLPASLLALNEDMSESRRSVGQAEQDTMISTVNTTVETGVEKGMPSGIEEEQEVANFLARFTSNGGVLELMEHYVIELASKHHLRWPDGLVDVYMSVFERQKSHMSYPTYRSDGAPLSYIRSLANAGLLQLEFVVDKAAGSDSSRKTIMRVTSKNSPRKQSHNISRPGDNAQAFRAAAYCGCSFADMLWLGGLTACPDILSEDALTEYALRFFWAEGQLLLLERNKESAADDFSRVRAILQETGCSTKILKLVNCRNYNVISSRSVESQLQALQRSRSLDEVLQLYDEKNFEKVVQLLLPTCGLVGAFVQDPLGDVIALQQLLTKERHRQLLLLQDSFFHLKDFLGAAASSESSIWESLIHYQHAVPGPVRDEWFKTACQLMKGMIRCFTEDSTGTDGQPVCSTSAIYSQLSIRARQRLASSVLQVAEAILEAIGDCNCDMPSDLVTPWILLYLIVKYEETMVSSGHVTNLDAEEYSDEVMPASLVLLSIAHEYVGRRSWCTSEDGSLLLFIVKVFMQELQHGQSASYRSILERNIEQCFFCLFAHPSKKAKAKHLDDHGCAAQILLTWKRAIPLFEYFTPKLMPSFDSYKSSAVSPELENLFCRIASLVPVLMKPPQKAEEAVQAYVDGGAPTLSVRLTELSISNSRSAAVVKDIFYLLADYYFKNKESCKAIQYYVTDICLNPNRFDSWAGLALAKCSSLESRLSSVETEAYDDDLVRQAEQTLRCFERALELDGTNSKLWVEYGNTAYHLASFASRLIKKGARPSLSDATTSIGHRQAIEKLSAESCNEADPGNGVQQVNLKKQRHEWLVLAQRCYSQAGKMREDSDAYSEEWLYHYMLGKIAEKLAADECKNDADRNLHSRQKLFRAYLENFKMAAQFLHEEGAPYPKKITFICSAPSLAIEVLEMYYRLHASILKYLCRECTEEDYVMLKQYLTDALRSPFAAVSETRRGRRSLASYSVGVASQEKRQHASSSLSQLSSTKEPVAPSASCIEADVAAIIDALLAAVSAACDENEQPVADTRTDTTPNEQAMDEDCTPCDPVPRERVPNDANDAAESEELSEVQADDAIVAAQPGQSHTSDPGVTMTRAHKQELVKLCLKALELCASRYPLHYKSYYRIAYAFVHLDCVKDIHRARDVLLGASDGPEPADQQSADDTSGFSVSVPQGLFQERKPNNFFNGVWRIPVAEIERPGSFAAHLFRTTELVLHVLESECNADLLCQLHMQLVRTPDSSKKFLCDSDRLRLATLAYTMAVSCYDRLLSNQSDRAVAATSVVIPGKMPDACLLNIYRLWCSSLKRDRFPERVNALLGQAYKIYRCLPGEVNKEQLDEAVQFCQQLASSVGRIGSTVATLSAQRASTREKTYDSTLVKPCTVVLRTIPNVYHRKPAYGGDSSADNPENIVNELPAESARLDSCRQTSDVSSPAEGVDNVTESTIANDENRDARNRCNSLGSPESASPSQIVSSNVDPSRPQPLPSEEAMQNRDLTSRASCSTEELVSDVAAITDTSIGLLTSQAAVTVSCLADAYVHTPSHYNDASSTDESSSSADDDVADMETHTSEYAELSSSNQTGSLKHEDNVQSRQADIFPVRISERSLFGDVSSSEEDISGQPGSSPPGDGIGRSLCDRTSCSSSEDSTVNSSSTSASECISTDSDYDMDITEQQ